MPKKCTSTHAQEMRDDIDVTATLKSDRLLFMTKVASHPTEHVQSSLKNLTETKAQ